MKRTKLFLGLVAIASAAATLYVSNNSETISERSYYTEKLSTERTKKQSWTEANEYINSLYVNPLTGKVEPADYAAAYQQALTMSNAKAASFTFEEDGPDNVGGRTRAIIVDPNNDFTVYAGSVDGGMYKSLNGGNNWNRLIGWDTDATTMAISSICMTSNGTLYVGTGGGGLLGEGSLDFEGSGMQNGEGVWYSTDGGMSFSQLAGTQNKEISRVAADKSKSDVFYYTGSNLGLKRVTNKGTPESVNDISNSAALVGVSVSPDGSVIICAGQNKVYVSRDSGNSFFNCKGNTAPVNNPIGNGGSRMECAVAYDENENGFYNLYLAAESGGVIHSIWYSEDEGENWYQIAPASTFGWEPCISANGQCYYDMVIDAVPGQPDNCIFGGVSVHRWSKTEGTAAWEADGQWVRLSPSIHADIHRFTWDSNGSLYIGGDGGMTKSFSSSTQFFTVINKGYNATQFYAIGYGPNDEVIGGSQDNGTQYNDHSSLSGSSYSNAGGGDGFECEISFLSNGEAVISTIYEGIVNRSDNKGNDFQSVDAPGAGTGFYNAIRLFEDDNDTDTKDSIQFIPDTSMVIGDTAYYFSETFKLPLKYVLTQNLTVNFDTIVPAADSILPNFDTILAGVPYYYNPQPQDTIMVPDTKQSLFVTFGNAVYLTRDMMRFSVGMVNNGSDDDPWWKLGSMAAGHSYEFSKDGNVLWIGSSGGTLTRISGLDSAYTKFAADVSFRPVDGDTIINADDINDTIFSGFETVDYSAVNYRYPDGSLVTYKLFTKQVVASGNIITDISTSALDLDRVCYSTGSSNGSVYLIENATSANPTAADIGGSLPNYPVFGCEFIMNPTGADVILVGTEFGAYSTDNPTAGSPAWSSHTAETGIIPVFDVRQQWRSFNQGATNPYMIYLGTHSRGIWKSGSYVGVGEHQVIDDVEDISEISIYPNPLSTEGNVAFELGSRSDVEFKVYDLQGKIINQVVWSNMNSGKHNMSFNVDKLPSGTYLVTLKAGTSTEVTKFIKY